MKQPVLMTLFAVLWLMAGALLSGCVNQTLRPGDEVPVPEGAVVLTVSGLADGREVAFDLEALERVGLQTLKVNDPWEEAEVEYVGVNMADLMAVLASAEAGETGTELLVTASDGYAMAIPLSEFEKGVVLLATKADGERIPADDKGPTRIIFPYDTYPDLDLARSYSVWNVETMELR